MMQSMQKFELSPNDMNKVTHSRAPLDSTTIDPKTRSPKHYETGKKENLSRSNLCLAHST